MTIGNQIQFVTGFKKTDPNHTRSEIHCTLPNIKATPYIALPRRTKHMDKDDHGRVCFHRRPFANYVNPRKCTTEPVKLLDGTNMDVSSAKLQLMTTTVYAVDCACFCTLLKTQHYCLYPSGNCNPPLAFHPPPSFTHPPTSLYTRHS